MPTFFYWNLSLQNKRENILIYLHAWVVIDGFRIWFIKSENDANRTVRCHCGPRPNVYDIKLDLGRLIHMLLPSYIILGMFSVCQIKKKLNNLILILDHLHAEINQYYLTKQYSYKFQNDLFAWWTNVLFETW